MRKGLPCALATAIVLALTLPALAGDLGIITGSEKGTYYQFGLNLQALGKANGFNVTVHPSKGSVENVFAVYQRPGVRSASCSRTCWRSWRAATSSVHRLAPEAARRRLVAPRAAPAEPRYARGPAPRSAAAVEEISTA
jgi:hypothetical protein